MAIIQKNDQTYEVLAYCKKCKAVTEHILLIIYDLGEDYEVIRYEKIQCLNCGYQKVFKTIEGRL